MTDTIVDKNLINHSENGEMNLEKLALMCHDQFLAIDKQFGEVRAEMKAGFEAVDCRFDTMDEKFERVLAELKRINYRSEIESIEKRTLKLEQAVF